MNFLYMALLDLKRAHYTIIAYINSKIITLLEVQISAHLDTIVSVQVLTTARIMSLTI